MEDFAFDILETLNANQQLDMLRRFGPKYGLDPENVVQMMHALRAVGDVINSELFMHTVMPNLMRLGLITERTEAEVPRARHPVRRSLRRPGSTPTCRRA